MKQKQVIMLCAYAQSGKDTVANHLVAKHGYIKMAFAEPIYAMIIAMYAHLDLSYDQLHAMKVNNVKLPGAKFTVRQMLQTLGTEWARYHVAPDIWASILVQKIHVYDAVKFVISDCRFTNEYDKITKDVLFTTKVWMINRDNAIPQTQHASEKEIEQIAAWADETIDNNFLFGTLYNQINKLIAKK